MSEEPSRDQVIPRGRTSPGNSISLRKGSELSVQRSKSKRWHFPGRQPPPTACRPAPRRGTHSSTRAHQAVSSTAPARGYSRTSNMSDPVRAARDRRSRRREVTRTVNDRHWASAVCASLRHSRQQSIVSAHRRQVRHTRSVDHPATMSARREPACLQASAEPHHHSSRPRCHVHRRGQRRRPPGVRRARTMAARQWPHPMSVGEGSNRLHRRSKDYGCRSATNSTPSDHLKAKCTAPGRRQTRP
jgi:hypothetical protein